MLTSNGSGTAPTWQPIPGGGSGLISSIATGAPFTVTSGALSFNTSSPIQVSSSTLTIPQANTSSNGYLSATDWNTFNNKLNGSTTGNLSGTANQITVSGGTGAVIGSGATLSLPQNIHTGAEPTFAGLTISGNASAANLNLTSGLTFNEIAGSLGQVLVSSGSGAPTWQTISGSGGYIISIAAGQPFSVTNGALSLSTSFAHTYISDWTDAITPFAVSGSNALFSGLTVNNDATIGSLNVLSALTLNGSAGISDQVLTSNGPGNLPTWKNAIASQWEAGAVTALDPNYFQIVNYAPNTICRTSYNRFAQSGNMTLSGTLGFTPTSGRKVIMTHISDGPYISNITQTGVTWSKITSWGYYPAVPAVVTEIWIGNIESGASSNFMVTYSSMNGYYTQCASLCDIMEYMGLDSSPVERYTTNQFFSGSPTDTGSICTTNPNDLIIGMIGLSSSVTQTSPKNGFTLISGAYVNGVSLATLELMPSVRGFYSSGTFTNGDTYVGTIVALKAAVQNTEQRLTMVGSGGGSGGSLSASSPLQLSNNQLSIPQANSYTNGYLASSDWNAFNSKQNALTINNLSGTANQVSVSGGNGAVIGSGVTLSLPQSIHTGASPTFAGLTVNGNAALGNLNVTAGLTFNGNAGTAGQVLTSNGSGNTPSWQSPSTGSGGGWSASPVSSVSAGVKINGTQLQLDPTYSPTFAGLTTTGNATIGGDITLGSNKKLTDAAGVQSAPGIVGQVLTVNASGYPVWTTPTGGTSFNQNLNTTDSPTFAGLTVNSVITSHASGSIPQPYNNAGMVLDFYPTTHSEGIGIQSGGPWIKYGTNFNIYHDDGAQVISAVAVDNNRNIVIGGHLTSTGGISIENSYELVNTITPTVSLELPTWNQNGNWHAYSNLGYGNILFKDTRPLPPGISENTRYPNGRCTSLYMIMTESPTTQYPGRYDPMLATDHGLWVEKDIQAYGALFTSSDPGKGTGGGAIYIGHGMFTSTDPPCIVLPEENFNTLELYTNVITKEAANLELGSLFIKGHIASGIASWLTSESPINITQGYFTNTTGYGYLASDGTHGYLSSSTGTTVVSLKTSYRIFCGGEIDVYSDQRDKNFIDELNGQTSISAIMKLNPLHFTWKTETKKGDNVVAGFFAQDVAKIIPEAVTIQQGTRYSDEHTLNYNVLTTYALSAIQEMVKEVGVLRIEIQQLKNSFIENKN